jgi:signal peptidase I
VIGESEFTEKTDVVTGSPETAESDEPASPTTRAAKRQRPFWIELPILILVAVIVAVVVRTFLVETFYIPSGSMEQTLLINDRVLVNKVIYHLRAPARGEVIVFRPPSSWGVGVGKEDFIKRVVGVGGDEVKCCDAEGRITVNGRPLAENYLYPQDSPSLQSFTVKVPKGRLFVLGDHRSASADSRYHLEADQGTVPVERVVGRAFAIFWPFNRAEWLSVPATFGRLSTQ